MIVATTPLVGNDAASIARQVIALEDTIDFLRGWDEYLRSNLAAAMPVGQKTSSKIAPGYIVEVEWRKHVYCERHSLELWQCAACARDDLGAPVPPTFSVPYPRLVSVRPL